MYYYKKLKKKSSAVIFSIRDSRVLHTVNTLILTTVKHQTSKLNTLNKSPGRLSLSAPCSIFSVSHSVVLSNTDEPKVTRKSTILNRLSSGERLARSQVVPNTFEARELEGQLRAGERGSDWLEHARSRVYHTTLRV